MEVREREKKGKERLRDVQPSPAGRAAPPPVSSDKDAEMPVAPRLPPCTWMQEPSAVAAILCQGLFIDLPATET